jgi:predicted dehydrogenase
MMSPAPPGRRLGYAVVGLGTLAIERILPAFSHCRRSQLAALVSGNRQKAAILADRYGLDHQSIYHYEQIDLLRSNPEVDVVYLVLPNSLHAEYAIRGAAAGKHVLCEKPMACTVAEGQQMIDACRMAGRQLMVAYRLRYEPYNQALIKIARDQELGPLRLVLADTGFELGAKEQWRLNPALAGGGSLMDIGIYAVNAARYLTGEEPIEATVTELTTLAARPGGTLEDTVRFRLRFPSDVYALCTSSYGSAFNRFSVVGAQGWAHLEPAYSYSGLRLRVCKNQPQDHDYPVVNHFAAEMDHLSECALSGNQVSTPGEEALRDLRVIRAIYEAARTGVAAKIA